MVEFAAKGSDNKHLEKLIRDYETGKLPPGLNIDVDAIKKKLQSTTQFAPIPLLRVVWSAFWEIKRTKDTQFPITHGDILDYMQAMRIELDVWEVKTILAFDTAYYAASKKHKS